MLTEAQITALRWILAKLDEHQIDYQIVGGLAAIAHGATRPLADIDLYIDYSTSAAFLADIAEHVYWGPQHERSDEWDITYLKLKYADQKIEIGDSNNAYFYERETARWFPQGIDYSLSVMRDVAGCPLKVMPVAQLIDYKSALNRDVDKQDVEALAFPHIPFTESALIRDALGDAWHQLPAATQARFASGATIPVQHYTGLMERIWCSRSGYWLARLARFLHAPLIPHQGENITVEVEVHNDAAKRVVHKIRRYAFPGRAPFIVRSSMRTDAKHGFVECVGARLAMRMQISVKDEVLYFRSTGYFFQLGRFFIRIPDMLTPGITSVSHRSIDAETFDVDMQMHHSLLGPMFIQRGRFREVQNTAPHHAA